MDGWRNTRNTEKWARAKPVLTQVYQNGYYTQTRNAAAANGALPAYPPSQTVTAPSAHASTSAIPPYNPYAAPRRPQAQAPTPITRPELRFKPSPFLRIDQAVSAITECPESSSATDRRSQMLNFTLTNDQLGKLKLSNYQLRLYCTSSAFYPQTAFRANTSALMEFPATCEVRVNNVALSANLKGMKKKPGTAPPADLGKLVKQAAVPNRVEMVYVNSTTQTPVSTMNKKYYMVVNLVETTSIEQLVDRLKKGKYRAADDVRLKMIESTKEDDDIIAGPQKMSLKCPLTFCRVNTPCRAAQCVHSQCFDGTSWLMVNEQTTTWQCPVCDRIVNFEDIIVDGYFDEILQQVPDSVEDVIVEADGEWHTADDQYASEKWRQLHPPQEDAPSETRHSKMASESSKSTNDTNGENEGQHSNAEIFVLDSDDEDEGRVKRELSVSDNPGPPSSSQSRSYSTLPLVKESQTRSKTTVIDLTLSDDEDDAPPPRMAEKRTASQAGLSDDGARRGRNPIIEASVGGFSVVNGSSQATNRLPNASAPPLPPVQSDKNFPPELRYPDSPPRQLPLPVPHPQLAAYYHRYPGQANGSRT